MKVAIRSQERYLDWPADKLCSVAAMCQLARCLFPLVRTDCYQRAFGRHQLLHAMRVLQHGASAYYGRNCLIVTAAKLLRKPRTLVPSPPAKTIAHTLDRRTQKLLGCGKSDECSGDQGNLRAKVRSKKIGCV
jgi:hypothetical protein